MALRQQLNLRQTQALVMTPQLQQAIKLLQMSNLEVSAFVADALESNPLLERAEAETVLPAEAATETPAQAVPAPRDAAEQIASDFMPDGDSAADTDYGNVYEPDSVAEADGWAGLSGREGSGVGIEGERDPYTGLSGDLSLRDHLDAQINTEIADPAQRVIAAAMVEQLDEAGYFTGDCAALAETLSCSQAAVEAVLRRLQGLDPPGIFARNLRECLALQLQQQNRYDPMIAAFLEHMPLLADGRMTELMRRCGCDADDLAEMVADIRRLDPKPAAGFEGGAAPTVVPDILMRSDGQGGWVLELNSETLPRLLVDRRYHSRIAQAARDSAEKSYITEQLSAANWLIRALDQRANTILRTASEIVRQQDGFFKHGVSALKPLTLRAVAEAIDMHESTISRVTSNKFIATPRGTFELKFFFTVALGGENGDAHSAESVRHRIKALIEGEELDNILSDDQLVTILRREGIDIARRTVAKYREAIGIPSSAKRRRSKRAKVPV